MKRALRPSKALYRDFPVEIRRFYGELVHLDGGQPRNWHDTHAALLEFVEMTLRFLCSLALSDYRSRHRPEPKVEGLLERQGSRNLPLGRLLELFRSCCEVTPGALLPPPAQFPPRRLDGVARLVAAIDAIGAAVGTGARRGRGAVKIDVEGQIGHHLNSELPSVDWWTGWQRIVEYRNKIAHSGESGWPTRSSGFWEAMTPLLHDAIVDLLTDPAVSTAILDYPIVALTYPPEPQDSGRFMHYVYVDDRGELLEAEIEADTPVTEQWDGSFGEANMASSYLLQRTAEGWVFRGVFWDLANGLPPAIGTTPGETGNSTRDSGSAKRRIRNQREMPARGSGIAPGTCGEFAQGILPSGTPFHITCPINKSATVLAELRPANQLSLKGLRDDHRKLGLAIENTVRELDLGPVEVSIRHWSDIDIGKGMGSSTADVLAGIRAVVDAAGEEFDPAAEGRLAATVESSDGSMYPGISVVNHRTCELLRTWAWHPELVIVMLVPTDSVDTPSIRFEGQEDLAADYEDMLTRFDQSIAERSLAGFAEQSTRSALLNNRFLLNPYSSYFSERLDEFGALGIDVGHTGTVCGLLFPNTEDGRERASDACFNVRGRFPELKDVKVVTTPVCRSSDDESD